MEILLTPYNTNQPLEVVMIVTIFKLKQTKLFVQEKLVIHRKVIIMWSPVSEIHTKQLSRYTFEFATCCALEYII